MTCFLKTLAGLLYGLLILLKWVGYLCLALMCLIMLAAIGYSCWMDIHKMGYLSFVGGSALICLAVAALVGIALGLSWLWDWAKENRPV